MRKIESIEELHSITLEIAKEFHRICVENNIPYYLVYGSLLGAVRHKGYIPWDDDMDVAVEYKYYKQLQEILKKELSPKYNLVTRYDKTGAAEGFLKIENTETLVIEPFKLSKDLNTGVYVDIFCLYPSDGKTGLFSQYSRIKFLTLIQAYRFYDKRKASPMKKLIGKLVKFIFHNLKRYTIIDYIEKHLISKNGNYFCTHCTPYGTRDIVNKSIYGTPTPIEFEGCEFYGVEKPHEYLRHMYGDYMKLPPENKRRIHMSEAYYKS